MQHRTAQGHMDHGIDLDWESIRSWIQRVLGGEKVAGIGVTVSTLTVLGWTLFGLHKAMQNYQILGSTLF